MDEISALYNYIDTLSELIQSQQLIINGVALIIDCMILSSCIVENRKRNAMSQYFIGVIESQIFVIVINFMVILLEKDISAIWLVKLLSCLEYMGYMFSMIFFSAYEVSSLRKKTYVSLGVIYVVVFVCIMSAYLWTMSYYGMNWFKYVDSYGEIQRGDAYILAFLGPFMVLVFDSALVLSCKKYITTQELMGWLAFFIFPMIASIISSICPVDIMIPGFVLAILLVYINVHAQNSKMMAEKEAELMEARIKIMVSQMQPHFMYNSLNTIYYLIGKDQAKAKTAVDTFSTYLRENIHSIGAEGCVPFEEELRHVKNYVYLEKLRFEDDIDVIYDIKETDFMIPPLVVQPLVENAIKHGMSRTNRRISITISVAKVNEHFVIVVKDDGEGFDTSELSQEALTLSQMKESHIKRIRRLYQKIYDKDLNNDEFKDKIEEERVNFLDKNEEHTHVGIKNVIKRIENISKGSVSVESRANEGTTVTIIIPMSMGGHIKNGQIV